MVGRWKRSGDSPMSMALTLAPLRRRTPRTNRGISTILTGRFRGGFANVSAVDTGCLCDRLGGVLAARPDALTSGPTPLIPAWRLFRTWRSWFDVGDHPSCCEQPGQPAAGEARSGNRGRSAGPLRGPTPEEDSPPVPGPSLKPRRSRAHPGGTGGVRMRGSRLSLTLESVPRRTREPRRFP